MLQNRNDGLIYSNEKAVKILYSFFRLNIHSQSVQRFEVPNIFRVFFDASVCGEIPGSSDISERFLIPGTLIRLIEFGNFLLDA